MVRRRKLCRASRGLVDHLRPLCVDEVLLENSRSCRRRVRTQGKRVAGRASTASRISDRSPSLPCPATLPPRLQSSCNVLAHESASKTSSYIACVRTQLATTRSRPNRSSTVPLFPVPAQLWPVRGRSSPAEGGTKRPKLASPSETGRRRKESGLTVFKWLDSRSRAC